MATSTIVQKTFKLETYTLFGTAQATGSNGYLLINNSTGQSKQLNGYSVNGSVVTLTGSTIAPLDTGLYPFIWDIPAQGGLGAGSVTVTPNIGGGPLSALSQVATIANQSTSLSFAGLTGDAEGKAIALVAVTDVSGNLQNLASGSTLNVTAHFTTSPVF